MQSGNVITVLFGAIGMVGVLGASTITLVKGPVASVARITDHNLVKNDLLAASRMISEQSLMRPDADCDNDGVIEPLPYRPGVQTPAGGGLVPSQLGLSGLDPWRREYGYCVWDHGPKTLVHNVAACGGSMANRLGGSPGGQGAAIALISAGPDGLFETSCHGWADNDHDGNPDMAMLDVASGSDDIVRIVTYAQFLMPSAAHARLEELPDAACTPDTVGIMRLMLGVVQVCSAGGWAEVAPAAGSEINFLPVLDALPGNQYMSNTVVLSALAGPTPVTVDGGAALSVNGGPPLTSATLHPGDRLALSAFAPALPEQTLTVTAMLGAVAKSWSITTRNAYAGMLVIQPVAKSGMSVAGPGNPAYGQNVSFLVTNTGEKPVGPLGAASLSNGANFIFNNLSGHVGDDCAGKTLGGGQSCAIDVRPQAAGNAETFQGVLNIAGPTSTASASLQGSASGWDCTLPWGGMLANGSSVAAYSAPCSLLSCTSQTRKCTDGVLSGSHQYQTCNVLLSCL